MADIQSNIRVNIDTSGALASIKALQREISAFQTSMARGGAVASAQASQMRQNLVNNLNASGQFAASVQRISSTTENFTSALEKNKMGLGQYFRYAGGASKSFGRFFKSEMDTIEKVAISRVKSLQTQYIKLGRDANGAMKAIAVRPLALDMQNLATKTAIAAQKQQLLNQLLKQGSTNLLNFGKNTQWAGRQLMVGFTIPLGIMGSAAVKAFKQMEEQAIKFKRVYGDAFTSTAETDKMLKQVQDLASEFTKYGVEVQKTMEMAATAAATGKTGADLLAQVSSATRLAVLGNIDQSKALETTISLTNAFGTAAEDLGTKINFLNAVENQTVTSIDDLTTAIPKAAPVIKQLGGNVEDLAFFLTAMREGGINASEGANALKSGLASMINPTTKARKMLSGLGIDINAIVEKDKGNVSKLVVDFAKSLDTLDPLSRARAIEQMFGKFQFARMSTLFKNVIQDGSQANRVLDLMNQGSVGLAALAQKELRQIQSSPLFQFQKAIADFKKELAPVGEEFMKAITPLINFGTEVLKNFNKLEPGMKQFIVNITGLVAGLGPILLMTFGLVANGVANLIKGFAFIKNVFNRASSASTVLGETTHYMTSEQIKAAAVAASLQQAHNKLTQAFTVETGALNTLISTYQKAASAQTAFNTGSKTKGVAAARKKFASGVVSVPGPKGAGDIVPSMLAPGEAVIPAKMASKYSGFIHGMISGNIPGFRKGRDPFQEELSRNRGAPENIRKQTAGMQWGSRDLEHQAALKAIAEIEKAGIPLNDAAKTHLIQWSAAHSGAQGSYEQIKFGGKMSSFKNWFARLLTPEHKSINSYQQSLIDRKSYLPGLDPKAISKQANSYGFAGIKTTGPQAAKFLEGLQNNKAPISKAEQAMFKAIADLDKTGSRSATTQGRVASSVLGARLGYKGKDSYDANLKSGKLSYKDSKSEEQQVKDLRKRVAAKEKSILTKLKIAEKSQAKSDKVVTRSKTETAKATKKVADVEKSKAKRVVTEEQRRQEAQKRVDKAKAEIAAGKRSAFTPTQAKAQSYLTYGSDKPTTDQRESRRAEERIAREAAKARGIQRRAELNARLAEERKAAKPKGRFGGMGSKVGGLAMTGMIAGGMVGGDLGNTISNISGVAFAVSSVVSIFPKLGLVLTRFLPVIGLVTAAFFAIKLTSDLLTKADRERAEQTKRVAEATNVTDSRKQTFADFFGITNKPSKYFVPSSDTKITNPQAAAVSELRLSDKFKEDNKTTIDALKNGSMAQNLLVLKNLQLSLSENFAPEQIAVIVEALKQEAGRTDIKLDYASIDVTTKEGFAGVVKNLDYAMNLITTDDSAISGNFENIKADLEEIRLAKKDMLADPGNPNYVSDYNNAIQALQETYNHMFSEENRNQITTYGNTFKNSLIAIRSALDNGKISMDEFKTRLEALRKNIFKDPEKSQVNLFELSKQLFLPEDAASVQGLNRLEDQWNAVSGAVTNYAETIDLVNRIKLLETDPGSLGLINPDAIDRNLAAARLALAALGSQAANLAKLLTAAQTAYQAIGDAIDNLQTGLDIIGLKEDKINDKYDKRLDALDKIQAANETISQQQQDQLDLADAITRGDVAGAARAMQQMRANAADRAVQDQRTAIESSRTSALGNLTDPNGRTRAELEKLIGKKKMQQLLLKFKNPDAANAGGGHITGPGTGTSDDIPAMLSNGEYVIRAKAAQALGINTLDKMNHAEKFMKGGPINIAKYATGGLVGGYTKGGPVNIAKYAKGGYASSDERRSSLNKPQKKKKKEMNFFETMNHYADMYHTVTDMFGYDILDPSGVGMATRSAFRGIGNITSGKGTGWDYLSVAGLIPGGVGKGAGVAGKIGSLGSKAGMIGKTFEKASPIIKGIFGKTGHGSGISSAGTTEINGFKYFLKKIGSKTQAGQSYAGSIHPEKVVDTALQEFLISSVLNKAGLRVPDLKFFPGMSSVDDGLVLGSKEIPGLSSLVDLERGANLSMNPAILSDFGRQQMVELTNFYGRAMTSGMPRFASEDAVSNAILNLMDRHGGNTMLEKATGRITSIDFGRMGIGQLFGKNEKPTTLFGLISSASQDVKSMQSAIKRNLGIDNEKELELLSKFGIPHVKYNVPGAPAGQDVYAELGQRVADMKPMADRLATAFGFNMSLATLPKDFAAKNPIIVNALKALRSSNLDKNILKDLKPGSQQNMLELAFQNIKTILDAPQATFKYANGGMVGKPKYFAKGGMVGMYANGGDVVPSMLTPGEFVVSQPAVKNFGVDNLRAVNSGTYNGDSMYNYSVNLSVNGSNANADDIARKVMQQIKRIDSQRVGGVRA
jgi:TP901 family phage tail tape measure protein